jgi:nitrite reductase/ring-hydroxylating ferredoxin subunit
MLPESPFNNPKVFVQSWYRVAPSHRVSRGKVISLDWLGRRVVLWRIADGELTMAQGHCPHMGADLGQGCVVNNKLQCGFHHWTFDNGGLGKSKSPGDTALPLFIYPTIERFGQIWAFNGPKPLFALPSPPSSFGKRWKTKGLSPHIIHCHPHMVSSNGFDIRHFECVHGVTPLSRPVLDTPDDFTAHLSVDLRITGNDFMAKVLKSLGIKILSLRLTTWGGNLAGIHWRGGIVDTFLFIENYPLSNGTTLSHPFLIIPELPPMIQRLGGGSVLLQIIAPFISLILKDDIKVLQKIQFLERFTELDAPLMAYTNQIKKMPVFNSSTEVEKCENMYCSSV